MCGRKLEGWKYWPDRREGQYKILRAEYFPIFAQPHSKCKIDLLCGSTVVQ